MGNKSFHTKVAGVSKRNPDKTSRQKIIKDYVARGHSLDLKREPDNPYDKNAVGVWWSFGHQIGYLSSEVAEEVSREIDAGIPVSAVVTEVTGGDADRPTYGVNIMINIGDDAKAAIASSQKKKKSFSYKVLLWVVLVAVICIVIIIAINNAH